MSVDLVRKSLRFIEEEDGLDNESKRKKAPRVSEAIRERQRIRALASHLDFDCETNQFIEDPKAKRRKRTDVGQSSRPGVSLVEQHRATKRVDLLKRNIKYMVYSNEKKLDSNRVTNLVARMSQKDRDKKHALKELLRQNDGLREPNPYKQKVEKTSVFTDEDFMEIGPEKAKLLQKKALDGGRRRKQK